MKALFRLSVGVERMSPRLRLERKNAGFSLIEISLALAIVAFAFVALIGMVAPGLGNFRSAMNTQSAAEIFRRVSADLQETDFDTLLASKETTGGTGGQFYSLPLRYFDEQGTEVRVTNPKVLTTAEQAKIIYTSRVRGSLPGKPDPGEHNANYFTSLPGVKAPRFNPRDSTYLTVQIALTRGRDISDFIDSATLLLKIKEAQIAGIPIRTYSALVTRNGYLPKL